MNATTQKGGKPNPTPDQEISSRRTFITRLWTFLGVLALVEWAVVGVAFLRRGKAEQESENSNTTVTCGAVEKFQPETVTAFVRGRFYLACLKDGGFMAISRQCTHLGCTVPWMEDAKRFTCPCHASEFDITGHVINAPAPRALDIFAVSIENNIVVVDISRPIQRNGFEKEQVVYPQQA
jgi:cytochrome b6-f complex iron-sulfur subunit